jgi:hypothetical protein
MADKLRERAELLLDDLFRTTSIEEDEDLCVTAFRAVAAEARAEVEDLKRAKDSWVDECEKRSDTIRELQARLRGAEQRGREQAADLVRQWRLEDLGEHITSAQLEALIRQGPDAEKRGSS